jgi:hypothetical protein
VFVLEYAYGCAERRAVEMVAERIATRLSDFEELKLRVPASGVMVGHVDGLHDWMRGHLEWGLRTVRYTASDGYLEDLLG